MVPPAQRNSSTGAGSLGNSFVALYRLLERPLVARQVVVGLLSIHTGLLIYSAYVHSPTLDEPAHLVAGLSIWRFGQYEIYSVNPPLVKMAAALPVVAVGYDEDWSGFYRGSGARPEFRMGEDFVTANGERSQLLFMISRLACIPFSWLGAAACFVWARDLFGRPSGLLACFIWCFEPNILAHASLMTPDAHAASMSVTSCYAFHRWLTFPSRANVAASGAALGLAVAAKSTLIVFYPLWVILWLLCRFSGGSNSVGQGKVREGGMLILILAFGLYVLNFVYAFEGTCTKLRDFSFVSDLLRGEKTTDDIPVAGAIGAHMAPSNRFLKAGFGSLPVPLPRPFVVGFDLQQKDFEHYDRPSYLRGVWRDRGWWYYYIYAAAVKMPLALLLLGLLATARLLCRNSHRRALRGVPFLREYEAGRPQLGAPLLQHDCVLLLPALAILCAVSSKTGFSEHFRYALPCFPPLFVWVSGVARRHFLNVKAVVDVHCPGVLSHVTAPRNEPTNRWANAIGAPWLPVLLCWFAVSSLWIFPHSLSYFNESIGGPLNGPRHLLGSNVDWGQDSLYVQQAAAKLKSNTEIVSIQRLLRESLSEGNERTKDNQGACHVGIIETATARHCPLCYTHRIVHSN